MRFCGCAVSENDCEEEWPDWLDETTPAPTPVSSYWADLRSVLADVGKPRNWLAEGAIENDPIIIFSGPEKSHKSWAALQLSLAVANGVKWLERFQICRPGLAVYLDSEYGDFEFVRRASRIARGLGLDPAKALMGLRYKYELKLALAEKEPSIAQVIAECSAIQPALIVVDPLRNSLNGSENDADTIIGAYRCLDELRQAAKCPVLVLHHLNKSGSSSGSRAISTRADLIFEGSDAETPTYSVRGRTIRPTLDPIAEPFSIEVEHIDDADDAKAATHLRHRLQSESSSVPLSKQLFQALTERSLSTNQLATRTNRSRGDTRDALEKLEESGRIKRVELSYKGNPYAGWQIGDTT